MTGASLAIPVVFGLAMYASLGRVLSFDAELPAAEAQQAVEFSTARVNRTDCAAIGTSDELRSPEEGLWYQSNCLAVVELPRVTTNTMCNRTSLDPADFTRVAPNLYVTSRSPDSQNYLWYASADDCFDLVSTRSVTAVCRDQSVILKRGGRTPCAGHGGVFVWVNGR